MTTVGLTFKRVFNEAHNNLQNTVLPLEAPSASAPPSSLNMPPAVSGLQLISWICSPDYETFIQRGKNFAEDLKTFLEHFKHVVILPLSWWLTIWHFVFVLTWALMVSAQMLSPGGMLIGTIHVRPYRSGLPSVSMSAKSGSNTLGCLPSGER